MRGCSKLAVNVKTKLEIAVNALPTYLDGGDGNMWQSRDVWAEILATPAADISVRRYVRVSDVIALLAPHGVKLVLIDAGSSSHGTIIESK